MAAVRPGASYRDFHVAAMTVLAHGLADMGILPVSAEEALDNDNGLYRRWTLHGTGHMLGLDVHDCCSRAERELPATGSSSPAWSLTVEPGLYFQSCDLLVPERAAWHRHPDRGRRPRHRRRLPQPVRGAATHADDVERWIATGAR